MVSFSFFFFFLFRMLIENKNLITKVYRQIFPHCFYTSNYVRTHFFFSFCGKRNASLSQMKLKLYIVDMFKDTNIFVFLDNVDHFGNLFSHLFSVLISILLIRVELSFDLYSIRSIASFFILFFFLINSFWTMLRITINHCGYVHIGSKCTYFPT